MAPLGALFLALALVIPAGAAGCAPAGPRILAPYGSLLGANGLVRLRAHAGVDFGAPLGSPVLASADGEVENVDLDRRGCGLAVLLSHGVHDRFTVYCHLSEAAVARGDVVKRGDLIGRVGVSGNAGEVPHVHFELCHSACPFGHGAGRLAGTDDPLRFSDGCFRPGRAYAADVLRLTHPVPCQD